jgi:ubiquinone/menaquinone biosynthesis C-methylase UbiE
MEDFLNPAEILKQLNLNKNMTAADFGSGSGGWAIPLAKKLQDGLVYAIDILNEPLSVLKGKMALEKIANIKTICSNIENKLGSTLPDSSVDLILMTNLLFQADDKEAILAEAKRILKQSGKVVAIDWKKEAPLGPEKKRITKSEVKKIAEKLDFKVDKEFDAGLYHWLLILVK